MERTLIMSTSAYPVYTPDEEHECAVRMKTAETEELRKNARDEMVLHNMRLVISMAAKYSIKGAPQTFSDLVQEGMLGLMTACSRYDPKLGYKFSTYATWWIKQALTRSLADKNAMIRTPVHVYDINQQIRKYVGQYVKTMGEDPKAEKIAEELQIDVKYVNMYFTQYSVPASLDTKVGEDGDGTLIDFVEDKDTETPEAEIVRLDRDERIMKAINSLPEKEATVIKMRFGFDGYEPMTLEEVGRAFGFTRERARQIEVKGLKTLRTGKNARILKELQVE